MTTVTLDQETTYDIKLTRGQQYSLRVEWDDSNGVPVNFVARTSVLTVVEKETDWDLASTLLIPTISIASTTIPPSADGSLVHDATGINLVVSSLAAGRLVKSTYPYHLWILPDDRPLLSGMIRVRKG